MKKHSLEAKRRTITGNQVKNLRKQGIVPATLYGKNTENIALELPLEIFVRTFKQAGETGLIELSIEGKTHPVLVKQVQYHPVTGVVLHVEFYEVNLKEKIKANVPVVLVGESPAVKEGTGTLLHLVNELEVEALPTDLPEKIELDISNLAAIDDQILVKEWVAPQGVMVLTEPDIMLVKIGELTAPEPEPVVEAASEETAGAEEGNAAPEEEQPDDVKKETPQETT